MNIIRQMLDGWTEDKWHQGAMRDYGADRDRVCLYGRYRDLFYRDLLDADANCAWATEPWKVIADVVLEQYGCFDPMGWNDAKGRTFADVRAVLEKAAARLDEAEQWS